MEPLYVDVVRLNIRHENLTTIPVFISGSCLQKADPRFAEFLGHDRTYDFSSVPSYKDFFHFIQDGKVTVNRENRDGLLKTSHAFGLPKLAKYIQQEMAPPLGVDYLAEKEITMQEYHLFRDKFDGSEKEDRFSLADIAANLPQPQRQYGNPMDDQLTQSGFDESSIRTEAARYIQQPHHGVPTYASAPKADPPAVRNVPVQQPPPIPAPILYAPDPSVNAIASNNSSILSSPGGNLIGALQEYCVANNLEYPIYKEDKGDDEVWEVKCIIKDTTDTMAHSRNKDDAKRESARKMLEQLKNIKIVNEADTIPSLEKEIQYFHEKLRDQKGKRISALITAVDKNDGRSGTCSKKLNILLVKQF